MMKNYWVNGNKIYSTREGCNSMIPIFECECINEDEAHKICKIWQMQKFEELFEDEEED